MLVRAPGVTSVVVHAKELAFTKASFGAAEATSRETGVSRSLSLSLIEIRTRERERAPGDLSLSPSRGGRKKAARDTKVF